VFITLNNHLRRPNSRPGERDNGMIGRRDNGMIQRRDGGHVFVENRQLILPNIRVDCRRLPSTAVDCRRLQTTVDMVDCSRLQAVQAAVLTRLPVLVFPEDWIVTCDPVRSRVRTGPNGPYGTLNRLPLLEHASPQMVRLSSKSVPLLEARASPRSACQSSKSVPLLKRLASPPRACLSCNGVLSSKVYLSS
jgi:hypothetical protein